MTARKGQSEAGNGLGAQRIATASASGVPNAGERPSGGAASSGGEKTHDSVFLGEP